MPNKETLIRIETETSCLRLFDAFKSSDVDSSLLTSVLLLETGGNGSIGILEGRFDQKHKSTFLNAITLALHKNMN